MGTPAQQPDLRQPNGNDLAVALSAPQPSVRLQAALDAGTHPDPGIVPVLIQRCGLEPDFFVRDMLTWALTRQPAGQVVPRLLDELRSPNPLAKSQSLHTLSKIGNPSTIGNRGPWTAILTSLLHDPDDDVARSAWRAAIVLVPDDGRVALAAELAKELGRGGHELRLSLSRALVALGDASIPATRAALASDDPEVRTHARATELLRSDPDREFSWAIDEARRIAIVGSADEPDADR